MGVLDRTNVPQLGLLQQGRVGDWILFAFEAASVQMSALIMTELQDRRHEEVWHLGASIRVVSPYIFTWTGMSSSLEVAKIYGSIVVMLELELE